MLPGRGLPAPYPPSGVSPFPQKSGPKPREKASEAQSGARMEIGGGWDRPRNSQGLSSLERSRMSDRFDLERFVVAQDAVLENVRSELRRGSKEGHWMWFTFPQLKGLGSSWMAQRFAISSRAEAEAYLAHPILGLRLIECTQLVNAVEGRSIEDIFGPVDTLKFRSSMTLFAEVARDCVVFAAALDKYFAGRADQLTLDRL